MAPDATEGFPSSCSFGSAALLQIAGWCRTGRFANSPYGECAFIGRYRQPTSADHSTIPDASEKRQITWQKMVGSLFVGLSPSETAEDVGLIRPRKDGQHPYDWSFPDVEDAKTSGIRLEGTSRQRGDHLPLTGKGSIRKPSQILNQPGPLLSGDTIEVSLRPTDESQAIRRFACHGGSPPASHSADA